MLLAADWVPALASVLRESDPEWSAARAAYAARFPSVHAPGDPLVIVALLKSATPARGPQVSDGATAATAG